ncbi:Ankyrin repeat family protein-like [Rhynchospora pubera]|uniref:Ankyrin repeat family protein-like n=1 Tax=Rhynchospora pubera TaxID=906938 RepID=A0AAV8CZN2_9POAL|nr:Ankyrin repeat family protein-like [Rhynchospora pubera]
MPFIWDRALRKANDLEDKNLSAALQLADGDGRWQALLRPPLRNRTENFLDEGCQLHVMCPDLYRATLSGSINRVNQLLGFAEDMTDTNDESHDVKVLLQDTPEINSSNKQWGGRIHGDGLCTLREITAEKNTVLHIAIEQEHADLAEQLIRIDNTLLTSQNSRHETPLHLAARAGNHCIISLIVFLAQESGIGAYEVLTKRSTSGDTILHEAARYGHDDAVRVLMTVAPALSSEVNYASMSPLYLAVVRKSLGAVKALLQYSDTSAVGPNQQNALHAAVLASQDMTSMLLDWNAELAYKRDASGSTPLHYAASNGDVTLVKIILEKVPLTVYIRDEEGSSPLHVAARMHHYSSITPMIDHCPDSFELHDNQGRNFLHIVAQHSGRETNLNRGELKKLISMIRLVSRSHDMKKLVNERDNDGNTPLHLASMNGFSETILQFLQASKADSMLVNNEGKTALDHAISLRSFFLMVGTTATLSAYGAIFSPQRQDKLKSWKDEAAKWLDRTSKNLLIVSVLIATIAFSVTFNVPGSYSGDGVANLNSRIQYNIFLVLDTIAMSASVSATMLLVAAKAVSKRSSWIGFSLSLILLWISLFTIQLAFVMAVYVAGSDKTVTKYIISSISVTFFVSTVAIIRDISTPATLWTRMKFLSSTRKQTQTTRQIEVQFPNLTSYVRGSNLFIYLNFFFYIITVAILWTVPFYEKRSGH